MLVVATSGTGYVLGSGQIIDLAGLCWTCAGTMMVAASANSLNQVSYNFCGDRWYLLISLQILDKCFLLGVSLLCSYLNLIFDPFAQYPIFPLIDSFDRVNPVSFHLDDG